MDAANHAEPPPAASPPASSSPTSGREPSGVAPDQDPTQLLTKLFADTTLTVPTDGVPNSIEDQTPPVISPAPGKVPFATPATAAGNNPGATSHHDAIIDLLTKLVGDGEPMTPRRPVPVAPPIPERASHAGGLFGPRERSARRREGRRAFKVPTDYLRALQESRERRRRRTVVRRNVRVLLSIHEDRASERGLSAMMARLATREPVAPAAEDATAPSSTEHDELGELLDKMELSFKD
ncbi:unnamed protein product [Urochloa humidicola]